MMGILFFSVRDLRVLLDISLKGINPDKVEMLILPRKSAWEKDKNDCIDPLVTYLLTKGIIVAAIYVAISYLGIDIPATIWDLFLNPFFMFF